MSIHTSYIYFVNDVGETVTDLVIGSGSGCLDGPSSQAQFSEPTGLCFERNTAIISCFGGPSHGCIKLYTDVSFACEFMSCVRQIYEATGFLPNAEQNRLSQRGEKIVLPFKQGVHKLKDSLAYQA